MSKRELGHARQSDGAGAASQTGPAGLPALETLDIGVIGLGYVGLPLAAYLGRHFKVTGFDIDERRVRELEGGMDRTREVSAEELRSADRLSFSAALDDLRSCNFYVVT